MFKVISLLIILLSAVMNSYAYTPSDESAVTVRLDEHWHPIGKTDDGKDTLAAYVSSAPGANNQTILQTSTLKTTDKPAAEQVLDLYAALKKNMKDCEVTDLQPMNSLGGIFNEWTTSFQCKTPQLSGSMLIVDADPKHIYTFAFNVNNSSYTAQEHSTAIALLKQNMQLCYNGHNCYFL
jgi:hypothetical protein